MPDSGEEVTFAGFDEAGSTEADTSAAKKKRKDHNKYYFQPEDEKYANYVRNDCTKEDAEAWLSADAKGTYIFRKGERGQDLCLSVSLDDTGKVWHGTVNVFTGVDKKMLYCLNGNTKHVEKSITELVDHYDNVSYDNVTGHVLVLQMPPGGANAKLVKLEDAMAAVEANRSGDGTLELDEAAWYGTPIAKAGYGILLYFFMGYMFYMTYKECADDGYTNSMGLDNCTNVLFEPMSFTDATYFMIVLMTTTGYGDQGAFVQSTSVMWFTCFFVVYGVAVVLTAIMIIAEALAEKAEEAKKAIQADALRAMFESGDEAEKKLAFEQELNTHKGRDSKKSCWTRFNDYLEAHALLKSVMVLAVVMLIGQLFMAFVKHTDPLMPNECFLSDDYNVEAVDGSGEIYNICEGVQNEGNAFEGTYTFTQSFYWAVVSGTTVGFGDLSPESDGGKWFCIFYLPILIVAFINFIGALQSMLKGEGSLEDILNLKLDSDLIAQLDKSGDGEVSKDEWLRAMMIALGKADEDLCDLICEHFDNLDADNSGTLDVDDLSAAMTKTTPDAADTKAIAKQKTADYNKANKAKTKARVGMIAM